MSRWSGEGAWVVEEWEGERRKDPVYGETEGV